MSAATQNTNFQTRISVRLPSLLFLFEYIVAETSDDRNLRVIARSGATKPLRHSGMMRKHQTSDAQLRIGESRDSGFDASHRPGMTGSNYFHANTGCSSSATRVSRPTSTSRNW